MTKQCRHGFEFLSCCNCLKDEIERLRSSLEAIAEFRVDARHNQEDYADAMARVAKNTLNGAYAVEPTSKHRCKNCGAEGEPGSPDFCSADCCEEFGNREPPLAHNNDVRREIDGKHDVPDSQYAGILAAAESGDAVNTGDLINALWWRLGNQRKELARKNDDLQMLARSGCKVRTNNYGKREVTIEST